VCEESEKRVKKTREGGEGGEREGGGRARRGGGERVETERREHAERQSGRAAERQSTKQRNSRGHLRRVRVMQGHILVDRVPVEHR
jgi:hypothetical protein